MALFANNKRGRLVKVAAYDTSLMLTLKDVIPNDKEFSKSFLVKKDNAPAGRLRDLYNSHCNSGLVRKIFTYTLKIILWEVAAGNCRFIWPNNSKAFIHVGWLDDSIVKSKSVHGKLDYIDLTQTDFKVPYLTFSFPPYSNKKDLKIYTTKEIFKSMVQQANSGLPFSNRPRGLDYFLPLVYEEFNYIKETHLKSLLKECFSKLLFHLKQGEEVRIINKEGETRFFRVLGKIHDEVMTAVVKNRIQRAHKEKYEKFFV
jgi:hypothetical protein